MTDKVPTTGPPAPDSSPFTQPKISEGYPLTPEEKKDVDRVVEESKKGHDG